MNYGRKVMELNSNEAQKKETIGEVKQLQNVN